MEIVISTLAGFSILVLVLLGAALGPEPRTALPKGGRNLRLVAPPPDLAKGNIAPDLKRQTRIAAPSGTAMDASRRAADRLAAEFVPSRALRH